jgi:hypothetical protein
VPKPAEYQVVPTPQGAAPRKATFVVIPVDLEVLLAMNGATVRLAEGGGGAGLLTQAEMVPLGQVGQVWNLDSVLVQREDDSDGNEATENPGGPHRRG